MSRIIGLVPTGETTATDVWLIAQCVAKVFGAEIEIGPVLALPRRVRRLGIDRYPTRAILGRLAPHRLRESTTLLAVTTARLSTLGKGFVLGGADALRGVVVLSLARPATASQSYGVATVLQPRSQLARRGIHELGHSYGLCHCDNRECAMYPCEAFAASHSRYIGFCASHLAQLTN